MARNRTRRASRMKWKKTAEEILKSETESTSQYKHQIKMVLQHQQDKEAETDGVGFVYTCGLYQKAGVTENDASATRSEFLVRNVPRSKMVHVALALNFLSDRSVQHEESISSHRLQLRARVVANEIERCVLLNQYLCTLTDRDAPVIELMPRFADQDMTRWGMYPEAPEGNDALVERIMAFKLPLKTIRHIDYNSSNYDAANCQWVSVQEALRNDDSWTTDVYRNLTQQEANYVKKHVDYFLRILE